MTPFLSEPEASMTRDLERKHAREDEINRLADEAAADIKADYERMMAQLTEWAKRLSYGGQELEGIGREIRAAQNDQRRPVHGISFDLEEHFYGQTDRLLQP